MWPTIEKTWVELVEELYADSWDSRLLRFRSPFAFRGTLGDWDLGTSLTRLGGEVEVLERHLLRNFRKYAHRDLVERDSIWHWLTLAQHHGLPTGRSGWSTSPAPTSSCRRC